MKKIITLLACMLLLSCSADNFHWDVKVDETTTSQENSQETSQNIDNESPEKLISVVSKIKASYLDNTEFNTCSIDAVKNCLSQQISENLYKELDASFCDDYLDESTRSSCKTSIKRQLVIKSWDITRCDTLVDGVVDCKATILREQALENKDPEVCLSLTWEDEYILNLRERCMVDIAFQLARESLDLDYCEQIPEETEKQICTQTLEQELQFKAEQEQLQNEEN